jgi:AraC-like DNA-binding protein
VGKWDSRSLMMRSQLVGPAVGFVREASGAAAAARLCAAFGLDEAVAARPEVVLPYEVLEDFLAEAARASGVRGFGLRLAERFPRGGYGVLEYACRTAPTARAALERIVRYVRLLNEVVSVSFEEARGEGRVEQRFPDGVGVGRGGASHVGEFFVATLLVGARALVDEACRPRRVWFRAREVADAAAWRALVGDGCELQLARRGNGLALPAALLDQPVRGADPALLALLDRQAEQLLGGQPAAGRTAELVRRRLVATFARGLPAVAEVAAELGMSARTLQRRLGDEGTSFAALLDGARHELALELVAENRHPLGEIAFRLGYAELSPFLRAFKRWTGKTPGALRAARG